MVMVINLGQACRLDLHVGHRLTRQPGKPLAYLARGRVGLVAGLPRGRRRVRPRRARATKTAPPGRARGPARADRAARRACSGRGYWSARQGSPAVSAAAAPPAARLCVSCPTKGGDRTVDVDLEAPRQRI